MTGPTRRSDREWLGDMLGHQALDRIETQQLRWDAQLRSRTVAQIKAELAGINSTLFNSALSDNAHEQLDHRRKTLQAVLQRRKAE